MRNKKAAQGGQSLGEKDSHHSIKLSRQQAAIVSHLQGHPEGLTAFESVLYLNITAFHPRICELRQMGYVFATKVEKTENGARYYRYYLASTPEQWEQAANAQEGNA